MKQLLSGLFVLGAGFLSSNIVEAKNLCLLQETEVMACQLNEAKKRNISICYNQSRDEAFYRIGKDNNNLEMNKNFTRDEPLLRWLNNVYVTSLGFENDSYYYDIDIPVENFGAKASITVLDQNGQTIMKKSCTSNSFGKERQRSRAIIDVDDNLTKDDITPFPIMFYRNDHEKLLLARKLVIDYDGIGKMNIPTKSEQIERCLKKDKLEKVCQSNQKLIYSYEQAVKLVPKLKLILDSLENKSRNFIFLSIDEKLYVLGADDTKIKNLSYNLTRVSEVPYNSVIGNWFEITKDKKLQYKDEKGKIKTIQLD